MDHDYPPALEKKRCEYADVKKQLRERNIRFQTLHPAKLKVHLREGMKTYNSAWEAAEGLLPLGIKTSISEHARLDKELNRIGWQLASSSCPHRGGMMTRSLIQAMEALQKDAVVTDWEVVSEPIERGCVRLLCGIPKLSVVTPSD